MKRTGTIIIGAGQAGLAVSRCLSERAIDHVVLERGRVGQRWEERWESLRLLSPAWMTRLPGWSYEGAAPDEFMTRDQVIDCLRRYAQSFQAPVQEDTTVLFVSPWLDGWRVITDRGTWLAENVVIATGHCQKTKVPSFAGDLPSHILQLGTSDYRNPAQFPVEGTVLVVGASASGTQLANELRGAGRRVILSVGRHTRLPRQYRGRDILYWLDRIGSFNRPLSDMPDPDMARREPSLQLVGSGKRETLDLSVLARKGVALAGHLLGFEGGMARFAADLPDTVAAADQQLRKVLSRIDRHIDSHGLEAEVSPAQPIESVPVAGAPLTVDLQAEGVSSVLWATGYERSYPWLHAPVLDEQGEIRQLRGRTPVRGLYVVGLQFMIRRNSSFLHGVGHDAEEIAEEIRRNAQMRREAA